jgi:hypothetical protein
MSAPEAFTCPRCGRVSHHPMDRAEGYCGACHDWTAPPARDLVCERGHAMAPTSRFRFDDEPGDSAWDTAALARFRAMGLRLGAMVDLYECRICDTAVAFFSYPPKRARAEEARTGRRAGSDAT